MKIQELLPHLKKGWVAMEEDGQWYWYKCKPRCARKAGYWYNKSQFWVCFNEVLKIEFDGDWKDSLMKCGEKK